jgi:hypothetical protein
MTFQEVFANAVKELKRVQTQKQQQVFTLRNGLVKTNLPDFNPHYEEMVTESINISYHTEKGKFPERYFLKRYPLMGNEELEYIRANYKQVTLPVAIDFISTISRAWHDSNWSVAYKQDNNIEDNDVQSYFEGGLPKWKSLEQFMKAVYPAFKITNPNGIIAINFESMPMAIDGEGNEVIDETELLSPTMYLFPVDRVIWHSNEFTLLWSYEMSIVQKQGKPQRAGNVLWLYSKEGIYKISQIGNFVDFTFSEPQLVYQNVVDGLTLVKPCGGVPIVKDGQIYFQSSFSYAVDILDMVAVNANFLQYSINNCVFPYRIMLGIECDFVEGDDSCVDGIMRYSQKQCPKCHGSGVRSRINPLGQLLVKPATGDDRAGSGGYEGKYMEYVSPNVDSLKFLADKVNQDEAKARAILHLKTTSSSVQGSPDLATTAQLDQRAMYAFIMTESEQMFDMFEWLLFSMGKIRYLDKFEAPEVTRPKTFDFTTESDMWEQLETARSANAPSFVIHSLLYRLIQTVFYQSINGSKIYDLITRADRLMVFSNQEVETKLTKGLAERWEVVLHDSSILMVDELIRENELFLDQDIDIQIEQLIAKAKEKEATLQAATPQPANQIFNDLGL